tara:strand:- start:5932 stop:6708 length:777 start_codon:yes stop_codon:yes gene_type:complete
MGILQTAERSSHLDSSENVVFQRHLIAYKEAAKIIKGTVLEIGSGEGYGIMELAPVADKYIALDKFTPKIPDSFKNKNKISFIQETAPPLNKIDSNTIDFVITFQVIEHVKKDRYFLREISRVLKPGGKLILTTPNILMSLTKSPWHVREYNPTQMKNLVKDYFSQINHQGILGNEKVMKYYQKNKEAVEKIIKWDIFNMQYWVPRWFLRNTYDILNRFNRHSLQNNNEELVNTITYRDYSIVKITNKCLDHFIIATK